MTFIIYKARRAKALEIILFQQPYHELNAPL